MIISVRAPAGAVKAKYGAIEMLVSDDGTLDVPSYVGKTLVGKANFTTTGDIAASAAALLAAGEPWEASYMLQAYGKPSTGDVDEDFAAAKALIAARGEPSASVQ